MRIISLGNDCTLPIILEHYKLKKETLPFDWIIIKSFKDMVDIFENEFDGFINKKEYLVKTSENVKGPQIMNDDSDPINNPKYSVLDYYLNNRYNIEYVHDFKSEDNFEESYRPVYEKYKRRIDRLYTFLKTETTLINFIFYYPDINKSDIDRLKNLFYNINPKLNYNLNIVTHDKNLYNIDKCNFCYINNKIDRLWIDFSKPEFLEVINPFITKLI